MLFLDTSWLATSNSNFWWLISDVADDFRGRGPTIAKASHRNGTQVRSWLMTEQPTQQQPHSEAKVFNQKSIHERNTSGLQYYHDEIGPTADIHPHLA